MSIHSQWCATRWPHPPTPPRSTQTARNRAPAGSCGQPCAPRPAALQALARNRRLCVPTLFDTRQLYSQDVSNKQTNLQDPSTRRCVQVNSDDALCSLFNTSIPNVTILSSRRLDERMNAVQHLQLLRQFLHDKEYSAAVKKSTSSPGACVVSRDVAVGNVILTHYDGNMDFACRLST